MQFLRFTLHPQTAFGTPLVGDTLFGQLCWAFRHCFGNDWLTERLKGYADHPFVVLSDAFPQGFLPLPTVPGKYWATSGEDRKALKKKQWLPLEEIASPFNKWQALARNDVEVTEEILKRHGTTAKNDKQNDAEVKKPSLQTVRPQSHNTINRATSTTGETDFAPYTQSQIWFHPDMRLDLYVVLDTSRVAVEELSAALKSMGQNGYGRDASIGLGKFNITQDTAFTALPSVENANAFLTLAPCAPQGLGFDAEKSFYHSLTRFGRHGDRAVFGNPFKRPVLLAGTGAVFTPDAHTERLFIGQGLKGVSASQPEAVTQGYAPVMGIHLQEITS